MAAKKKAVAKADLKGATAMHFSYHPEQKLVRVNVQQTLTILGEKQRQGRDIDIATDALDADILSAITDAFGWLAEDVGATPFEPESE